MIGRRFAALALALGAGLVWFCAGPAEAELDGACQAMGRFEAGTEKGGPFTVDAAAVGTETVVVPRNDTVAWSGAVASPPGAYRGSIAVDLPAPFGEVTIDTWEGDTQAVANEGVEDYDLPALVPSGVRLQAVGRHVDAATECHGFVNIEIEGSPLGSPVTLVMLGLTVAAGWGFAVAVRPVFRQVA